MLINKVIIGLTELSLVAVRQLDQSTVFFVVENLHPLDITVDSCREKETDRKRERQTERAGWRSRRDRAGEMEPTKIKKKRCEG